jgi:hypothetical protein
VVRGLEVAPVDSRDEVEDRIGLPFGMLVSLLQNSSGEIRLSVPVEGDLSRLEFDYREAVWATIRNLSVRLLVLPFSRIGSSSSVTTEGEAVSLPRSSARPSGTGDVPHLRTRRRLSARRRR